MIRYNPKQLEKKWAKKWEEDSLYEPAFSVQQAQAKKDMKNTKPHVLGGAI